MNKFLIIATTSMTMALASLVPATTAYASSDDDAYCGRTSGQWMSKSAARAKAAQMGFNVRRVKRENGCYEIYAISRNGARVEIYMNPVTGAVVRTKNKS